MDSKNQFKKRKTLIMMKGLPRSGKSTMARAMSKKTGSPIVTPDEVRLAIHGQAFIPSAEKLVWAHVDVMVRALFGNHDTVILDATNMTLRSRDEWRKPRLWDRVFLIVDTDPDECCKRAYMTNQKYLIPVIEKMHQYHEPITDDELDPGDTVSR